MSPRKTKVSENEVPKTDMAAVSEGQTLLPDDAATGQDPPRNSDAPQTDPGLKVQPRKKAKKKENEPVEVSLLL